MSHLVDLVSGARYPLGELTRIGREPSCHVQLADPRVSRVHAEVRRLEDGAYSVVDLGSRAGTLVGGEAITQADLVDGDELVLGETRLRFEDSNLRSLTMDQVSIDTFGEAGAFQSRLAAAQESFPQMRDLGEVGELQSQYERLRAIFELMRAASSATDLPGVLKRILETVLEVLQADRGAIILFDPATGRQLLRTARSRGGVRERWVLSRTVIDHVISRKEGIICGNTADDQTFRRAPSLLFTGVQSVMAVPLLHRNELVGLLYLDSQHRAGAFEERDLRLLLALAAQSALVVKNAVLRRRIESVADAERRRLGRALRGLRDGVIVLDGAGHIALMNPRASELLPLISPAQLGEPLDRLGGHDVSELLARDGAYSDVELPGPPRRVLQLCATRAEPQEDAERETVIVLRDVTKAREQEQNSARGDRLMLVGQLAGGIAHDFNNLLCVISNYSDLCAAEPSASAISDELAEIRRATQAATSLTRQLLAFSRRELVRPRVLQLDQVVNDLQKILRRALGEQIHLVIEAAQGLWRTKADPGKIEQVLMNLAVNARDAMPCGGTFSIHTVNVELQSPNLAAEKGVAPGRYVALYASDTGVGMERAVAERVFEPFFTTKAQGKGTGLGLSTVYGIVQQAGGNVLVESAPGRGTRFEVLLPTTEESLERETGPGDARGFKPGLGKTVLLVEDEAGVRRVAARVLRNAGFSVVEAEDGLQGLRLASDDARHFDVVLTDVMMPNLVGTEMVRRILLKHPALPIVFMSGYTDARTGTADDLLLRAPFLGKPFTPSELITRITDALGPS